MLNRMSRKVIQIRLNNALDIMESVRHCSLKCGPSILKANRELLIGESTPKTDKCGLVLINQKNMDLVVPRKPVHKRKYLTRSTFVNDLVNKRSGIVILRASAVDITVIHTDTNNTLLLIYRNNIRNPLCQGNQINKTIFIKFFNFSLDGGCLSRVHGTKTLANRLCTRITRDLMHNYTQIDAGHFFIRPSENVLKLAEVTSIDLDLIWRTCHCNVDVLENPLFNGDINRYRLCNVSQVSFRKDFMCQDGRLKRMGRILGSKLLETSRHGTKVSHKRGTMMIIVPRRILKRHGFQYGLISGKYLV